MMGLDTNVLVRYIMQDDPKQSPKANKLMESLEADQPGFISLISVIELYWVLTSCYDLNRAELSQALEALVRTQELVVDRADQVVRALRLFEQGNADFADCLIAVSASAAGCAQTMTFDVAAAKHTDMQLIG